MIGASFDSNKTPFQDLLVRVDLLLQRIEAATDKSITREPELFRAGVVAEACDEGPEEWDVEKLLEEAVS